MKVLCIDGGGIRGLIPALVLAEIEQRTGRRMAELVDFIAGTSTGGILACALARPGADGRPQFSAEELAGLYVEEGPRIFRRDLLKTIFSVGGWLDERYEDDGLNAALERYLGDAWLSDALVDVMITAYDIHDRFAFFFRSARARHDPEYDFTLAAAARATSAAPSYFEPAEVTDRAGARTYPLIDGGVYAVNPAMCAYADVVRGREGGRPAADAVARHRARTRGSTRSSRRAGGGSSSGRGRCSTWSSTASPTRSSSRPGTLMGDRYVRLQTELEHRVRRPGRREPGEPRASCARRRSS